jgi:hypothetical protein
MPLTFSEVYAQQDLSFENSVIQYSVTGGVPKYMEFFDENESFMEQMKENVLSKNGFLYEEPIFLLDEEVQTPTNYFSIIKTIADGNHKLGSISSILNLDNSTLSPYISTLMELGYIEKRIPVTENNPAKSRKGLYFISDNFMRFWFRYVYPFKGELELDNQQIALDELEKDFINKFVAFSYEVICQNIFAELCKSEKIDFVPSKIGSYWLNDFNGDTEIDVMAVDNTNKFVFCGECKYHVQPVDADVYFDLRKKVENSSDIQKKFNCYEFIYGVFSKSGFTDRLLDLNSSTSGLILINEDTVLSGKQIN